MTGAESPTFITGNPNKVTYLAKWLGARVEHKKLDLDEIQSLDLQEVVERKVRQAYELLERPVIVEDASLIFTAMGRLPGTFIRWFIEELGYDGLARLAASLDDQTAIGHIKYAYYNGHELHTFDGEMRGKIIAQGRGSGGFGFDPIFVNEGYDITRAEMNEETYASTSYRKQAIEGLAAYLTKAA